MLQPGLTVGTYIKSKDCTTVWPYSSEALEQPSWDGGRLSVTRGQAGVGTGFGTMTGFSTCLSVIVSQQSVSMCCCLSDTPPLRRPFRIGFEASYLKGMVFYHS